MPITIEFCMLIFKADIVFSSLSGYTMCAVQKTDEEKPFDKGTTETHSNTQVH